MTEDQPKCVVITGVSTGIGLATAQELIESGYRVFGSVRTRADAERIEEMFGDEFTPLLCDVTDAATVRDAAQQVAESVGDDGLYGLVNNAGIAVSGPLMHLPLDELRQQFEVNLFGVVAVTQAFLPLLGARRDPPHPPGRIINISSVSGSIAYPFLGPYAASKHALEALSDSLRRELLIYDIDVIVVAPGSVRTPIWDKAEQTDVSRYESTIYGEVFAKLKKTTVEMGRQGMPVERVSRAIRLALEVPKPKTRYLIANNWLFGWVAPRWMPARWMDRLIANQLGFS